MKLDNLFVCDPAQPGARSLIKILDFGVAKVTGSGDDAPAPLMVPTGTGVVVGTPRFFAPEQARGQKLDHRADIYAMGLVLYSMLVGRGPFDDATSITEMAKAHVLKPPDPPSRLAKQPIPESLDMAILRAIAKQPEQRWQSAAEFSAQLDRVARELAAAPTAGRQAVTPATSFEQPSLVAQSPAPQGYTHGPHAPMPMVAQQPSAATGPRPTVGGYPGGQNALTPMPTPAPGYAPAMPFPDVSAVGPHRGEDGAPKRYPWPVAMMVTVVCGLVGVVIALAVQHM